MKPDEIKNIRELLKLSQEKFAQLVGVTVGSVSRWENGTVKPNPLAIARLNQIKRKSNG